MLSVREKYWRYSLFVLIAGLGLTIFAELTPFLGGLLGAVTIYVLLRRQMWFLSERRRWRRRSEQGPEPRPEQGSEPERSESAEPRSERRSEGPKGRPQGPAGRSETEPAGGQGRQGGPGRPAGAADAFGHLAAGTAADARRHPGPGRQDPGETQGETGRGRPRKEKLVVF